MILMTLMLQATIASPTSTVTPPPQRWSILAPPACPGSSQTEVVVCGTNGTPAPRLPLPDERLPQDRPRQAVGDPRAALDNAGPVCPPGGCTGVDLLTVPVVLIRGIGALIDPHSCCENGEGKDPMALLRDVGRKFRKKPDKANRVPIVLDEPPR
ncbi:hypothetical protein [Sphingomonas sp. Leaf38]|jgi:hypothetical protein|uniref:hypothetical protein n=1 Tax=Sphingomonas sp. Leaf38 TaxID=1736217 RepID=UPI0006F227DE|nr:hypothetical protein [Sphingomonas sp. Leaf38]KQN29282.1 hypothetical protein ASE88_10060 [Sphingomonas sp. Leaf38]